MAFFIFGVYQLDMQRFELRRSGVNHPLEPKAFNILVHLFLHRDRVVSKEELLDKFWPDEFVSESVLTRSVNIIRHALDDDGVRQHTIKTIRRRGYRFIATVEVHSEDVLAPSEQASANSIRPEVNTSPRWLCPVCQDAKVLDESHLNRTCLPCGTADRLCCTRCQTENPPQANFCLDCGAVLGEGQLFPPSASK